jgi:hypothetical protein
VSAALGFRAAHIACATSRAGRIDGAMAWDGGEILRTEAPAPCGAGASEVRAVRHAFNQLLGGTSTVSMT